jgi:hypothetical protein
VDTTWERLLPGDDNAARIVLIDSGGMGGAIFSRNPLQENYAYFSARTKQEKDDATLLAGTLSTHRDLYAAAASIPPSYIALRNQQGNAEAQRLLLLTVGGPLGGKAAQLLVQGGKLLATELTLMYGMGLRNYCAAKQDTCLMIAETAAQLGSGADFPSVAPNIGKVTQGGAKVVDDLAARVGGAADAVPVPNLLRSSDGLPPNLATSPRVFYGVEVDSRLPPPAAGWDYAPDYVPRAQTENLSFAQMTGFQAEIKLANEVAAQGEVVVKWGDKVGMQGSDIISVNPNTGVVTLWDNKFRSADRSIPESTTFSSTKNQGAIIEEARRAIQEANLSPAIEQRALMNIGSGTYVTNTVGSGGARNSVQVRYCNGSPC